MKKLCVAILLYSFFFPLNAEHVDIVSFFTMHDTFGIDYGLTRKAGYEVETYNINQYETLPQHHKDTAHKIIVANYNLKDNSFIFKLPKEKLVFFVLEPWTYQNSYFDNFSRVYTWDDSLVDNKKIFKLYYAHLRPMRLDLIPFEEKKFCTLIASNYTPQRIKIIKFFEKKPDSDLDVYGYQHCDSRLYRGSIPGSHSGDEKSNMLKNYKFCICFENSTHFQGYITEKIFACFQAGCIPVYWGATNVTDYIPKDCFIDYCDFECDEDLYQYLKSMPEEIYTNYLNHIRTFLSSEQAKNFSQQKFEEIFLDAVKS